MMKVGGRRSSAEGAIIEAPKGVVFGEGCALIFFIFYLGMLHFRYNLMHFQT